jgi:aspartyl protease family protein
MVRVLVFTLLILVSGVTAVRYVEHAGQGSGAAPAGSAMLVRADPQTSNARTMVIRSGAGGYFYVESRIDGRRLPFVVDTGASQITIRERDAARLGFHPTPRDYSVKIGTANGVGRAALMQLGMVEVGDIIVRDIPALVVPDKALSMNLLGMSFLSRVRWSHERGKFILEQ